MKASLSLVSSLAFLLATSALAQTIVLDPHHHANTNSSSCGFSFTANTEMVITQLDLPSESVQAEATASYSVDVNGSIAVYGLGNPGPIPTTVVRHCRWARSL